MLSKNRHAANWCNKKKVDFQHSIFICAAIVIATALAQVIDRYLRNV